MADFSQEEVTKLVEALKTLKVKPKTDTPEDLELWLKAYGAEQEVKKEPGVVETKTTVVAAPHHPRISLFYGDNIKGEASYAQWVYEVKCLLREKVHKPEAITQAIRNSLRGEASNLLRRLGYGASVPEILDKFESVYGEVDSKEHLLAKFYSSKQEEHEDVTKWSCRLEDILSSAVERKLVDPEKVNEMLKNMFYQGLKPSLKDICTYKFEQIADFDKLRVAIRKIEQDHMKPDEHTTHCKASVQQNEHQKDTNKELKEMKSMIQSLTSTVQKLENKVNSTQTFQGRNNQGFDNARGRGKSRAQFRGSSNAPRAPIYNSSQNSNQHASFPNQSYNQSQTTRSNRNQSYQYRYPHQSHGQGQRFNFPNPDQCRGTNDNQSKYNPSSNIGQRQTRSQQTSNTDDYEDFNTFNRGPLCFRCRQYGHYQWDCGVRMDHSHNNLN